MADWRIQANISLGFLYVGPILLVSGFFNRGQIAAIAAVCAVLREVFSPFNPGLLEVAPRFVMG